MMQINFKAIRPEHPDGPLENGTVTACVCIEADIIEEARATALTPSFYTDHAHATFQLDDGNDIHDVYLPDDENYEELEETPAPNGP